MSDSWEFYELHDSLRDGSNPDVKDAGLSPSTLRTLRQTARVFFRDALKREWSEDIVIGTVPETKITADDIFVSEEIEALFSVCQNPRDKAIMGVLLATGQRMSATLSLRVGDVDLSGRTGVIHLNDEAVGLKGAGGPRPLLWATEYVKNWLDVHPSADDESAALFCVLGVKYDNHPDERRYEALSASGVRQQLRRIATRAGVEKPVNPHNFRHTAITRMVRDGVPDQQIKWTVGWKKDSSQFDRYTHLRDDEMLQSVLEHHDLAEPESDIGRPTLETCPSCGAALDGWVNPAACPGCGLSLSHDSLDVAGAAGDGEALSAALAGDISPEGAPVVEAVEELLRENPNAVAARLAELLDSP
ncbi:tyrosine-type recombinase/integrase [Halococcus sediminicola]|uniref:tyrosine-type recombinase/integrase n=1 Tax=Halococcus sediminicola TaxID=1264579 RepID=UPI00067980E5|nr:tyrosine-type recombinase/integrase [Halococcus sediminicola]